VENIIDLVVGREEGGEKKGACLDLGFVVVLLSWVVHVYVYRSLIN